ncbi:ATP-binding cassette domain-containing protein [Roseomonas gilardii]|uniref:ATP-binding cassette domain-containing protein n=1 Tax=Roseomonas gilardii TaxID=257708 RepID=A0A1L7AC82_9PROT|nr:ATP-binding cassette domain-containing protein [Roseomonas gilardii]APT56382.1 sulfate ABC transporter ATP-binding protein [Roseomonas gilardii]MDT8332030.1 ATP-binding cassette domain-containing protein [Roseomonas gilardii]PZR13668.1 MAG: sulfate ABC transporter ATP-binding protein [Azospirillum brasilense]
MSVEVSGITRRFQAGPPALDSVDLAVGDGEFVALLGPSGSGKTTLLRILAGLDFPDGGQVRIDGRDVASLPARLRGIGFVPQNYALFRHMSVFENVAFGLRVRPRATRPSEAGIGERVRRLLSLVQIAELERRYPDQISGGQRQRVALARALAIEPALLLLDEPFSALDAQVRKSLRGWLRELHERLGLTSIFVTHDQEEAMEIADRVAVLRAGRIEQFDTPGAILARPASAFVAGFLGEANRLDCEVRGGQAHFGPLPLPPVEAALPDGPALAFLRAHDLVAQPGEGPWVVRQARQDPRGLRLQVSAGGEGPVLDAMPEPDWREARRGDRCTLRLLSAAVFPRSAKG